MHFNDTVNGIFEAVGAAFTCRSVLAIRRDRGITGVCWTPWAWFSAWGVWNLYYYPSLDQLFSFAGGALMVTVNALWLGHVAYYKGLTWEVLKTKSSAALLGGATSLKTFIQTSIASVSSRIRRVGQSI